MVSVLCNREAGFWKAKVGSAFSCLRVGKTHPGKVFYCQRGESR